jgi:hypothetical protein
MPSVSVKQRKLMGLAEHHPDQVYSRNRGVLGMNHQQLHDYASTKQKGLPDRVFRSKLKRATGRRGSSRRRK